MKRVQVISGDVEALAAFCAALPAALPDPWELVEGGGERHPLTEARLRARYREGCFGFARAECRLERPEPGGGAVEVCLVLQAPAALATALPQRHWDDPALEELKRPADGYLLCGASLEQRAGLVACIQRHLDIHQAVRPVLELTREDAPAPIDGVEGLSFTRLPLAGDLAGLGAWLRREEKHETPAGRTRRSHLLVATIFLVAVLGGLLLTIFAGGPDPVADRGFALRRELVRDRTAGYPRFAELGKRVREELLRGADELREPAWRYAAGRLERLAGEEDAPQRRDLEEAVLALHLQGLCAPSAQQREDLLARQRAIFHHLRSLVTASRSVAELGPVTRLADELLAGVRGMAAGDGGDEELVLALEVFASEALRTELEGRLAEVAADGTLEDTAVPRALVRVLETYERRVVEADLGRTTLLPEVEEALAFLRAFPLAGGSCRVELGLRQLRIDGHPTAFQEAIDLEERWWLIMGLFHRAGTAWVQEGGWHKGFDFTLSRRGTQARVLARLAAYQRASFHAAFEWTPGTELAIKLLEDDAAGDDTFFELRSRDPAVAGDAWCLRGLDVLFFKALAGGVRVAAGGRPAPPTDPGLEVVLEFDLAVDGRPVEILPALLAALRGDGP